MTQRVITIGADPEMFVIEKNTRKGFSAFGMVPGTKQFPHAVNGGAVQVDGMALEINVNPSETREGFMQNIATVMHDLSSFVPPFCEIAHGLPCMEFDAETLSMQPPEALELGCEPDYDAYTSMANPRPDGAVPFRTASGHIHVGWGANIEGNPYDDKAHFQLCCDIAKQLDYYVGLYSLRWDQDARRRTLYGRAGAFRAKSYGLEYRTPSTAWLASEHLQAWVFDATKKGVEDYFNGNIIDLRERGMARELINRNRVNWVEEGYDFNLGLPEPYIPQQMVA